MTQEDMLKNGQRNSIFRIIKNDGFYLKVKFFNNLIS